MDVRRDSWISCNLKGDRDASGRDGLGRVEKSVIMSCEDVRIPSLGCEVNTYLVEILVNGTTIVSRLMLDKLKQTLNIFYSRLVACLLDERRME